MMELVESVKTYGLLQPVLLRPLPDGTFEMVSGHRRKRAFELAGIEKIPSRIRELSRDEAILMMVDSNLQRDEILPLEKAKAYKMRMDALKRQGQRTDLTSRPLVDKSDARRAGELVAEAVGESERSVQRYIRLTELTPELLTLVDEKRIALRPAVELSTCRKRRRSGSPSRSSTAKLRLHTRRRSRCGSLPRTASSRRRSSNPLWKKKSRISGSAPSSGTSVSQT